MKLTILHTNGTDELTGVKQFEETDVNSYIVDFHDGTSAEYRTAAIVSGREE